jgi:hypothetical protein
MGRSNGVVVLLVLLGACGSKTRQAPPPPPSKDAAPPTLTAVPAHEDPLVEAGPAHATQIAVGYGHACARMSDDTMRCWGSNDFGELGAGTLLVATKQATPAVTGVVEVSAGYGFTCARLRDHTVRCWGNALDNEIGVASPTDPAVNHSITAPTVVPGLTDAVQIGSSLKHSCAVRADGTVACWGDNTYGQLGDGAEKPTLGPVAVEGLDGVTQIGVGDFTCARRVDGTVKCWGTNTGLTPQPIAVKDVVEVRTGNLLGCARDGAGVVSCWGADDSGQLGRADDAIASNVPAPVAGLTATGRIAVAGTHACAIAGAQLLCWGDEAINPGFASDCLRDTHHTGGGGSPAQWRYCSTPTAIAGITDPVDVGTMARFACVLTATHAVLCWGDGAATPTAVEL